MVRVSIGAAKNTMGWLGLEVRETQESFGWVVRAYELPKIA